MPFQVLLQLGFSDLGIQRGQLAGNLANFTITEFIQNLNRIDGELLNSSLPKHASGISVLGNPRSYEDSEGITGEHVNRVLQTLRQLSPKRP